MQNNVTDPLLPIISTADVQESYFDVLGICCSSEVPLIQSILKSVDGIKGVKVIVPTKTVIVRHDPLIASQSHIVKALNGAKMEASVRGERAKSVKKRWPNPFTIASGVLLLLSFLKYVYSPLQWLALGSVAFVVFPIALRAFAAVYHLNFGNINILVLTAAVGSIALEDYWEAGVIVFLFTISEWLESLASQKASDAMTSLINLLPQRAVLAETGEEIDVSEIQVNTVITVKEGETVPVDGIVVEGNCEVDEKSLSGESFPVAKQKGSSVWAGTINVNGYIAVRTTTLAENCVLAKMTRLVEEAHGKKSQIQRYIDKCTKYYTPMVILISASLAIIPAALRVHNQKEWFHIALVALVSACPCALVLSTPIAMFCALTNAAKHGVFFKGADCLETLAKVKIMAFDKTGTVTRADFEVTEFRSLSDDISHNTLLYWVSSIQSKSSHPIAAALIDFAQSHSVQPKANGVEDYKNFPGEGIFGCIDGKEIYIGNLKLAARAGCNSATKLEGEVYQGKSVGYVFLGSTHIGIFCLADVCRTGAKEALKELKSMGIKVAMLTGDCNAAAKHAADQLGGAVDVVHAELLPEDKAKIVKDFQKAAKTAMIGDGINDAPALATADVGISMGISGSALATETGDVILMTNDILRIPKVARLARKVRRKILENMIFSVATKGSVIALAVAGHPVVWAAVLADVGTCLLVILNSMLLLRDRTKGPMEYCRSSKADIKRAESDLLQKEAEKPKCSNTVGGVNCCKKANKPDDGISVEKPKSCCGNRKQIQEAKCSKADIEHAEIDLLQKEAKKTKCSNTAGAVNCCKKANKPDDGISVEKPKSCCGNQKQIQEAKCSNVGEAESSDSIERTEIRRSCSSEKGCCGNVKQSPKVNGSNPCETGQNCAEGSSGSLRKKCCTKSGYCGGKVGAELSEIIIE